MTENKPQNFEAIVSDKYFLTDNEKFVYIKFELVKPDRIQFLAGQYVSIKINATGERRSYSIASTPDDNHGFHLIVEVVGEGKGANYFRRLQIGDRVSILAPLGNFTVAQCHGDTESHKLLFVATGSGIVPLWSMINDLLVNYKDQRQIRLHWGMRSEEDLFFIDDLQRLSDEYPNFVFDIVLSKPGSEWELCSGHVQDCLQRDFVNGLSEWEVYVCGKQQVVIDIIQTLKELNAKEEWIYHEKFT